MIYIFYNIFYFLITGNSFGMAKTPDEFCYLLSHGQLQKQDDPFYDIILGGHFTS